MNKKKFLIVLCLAFVTLLSAIGFTACTKDGGKSQTKNLIAGFETYHELIAFNWQFDFGRAEVSEEHVTQGEHSVKLAVRGNYRTTNKPTLTIKTATESLPKTDWLDVSSILVDVYNDNDTVKQSAENYLSSKSLKK